MLIHPPAVAGSFYPEKPSVLQADIKALLDDATIADSNSSSHIRALIVPHAGYIYSGPVAASAYACLINAPEIKRVVLFGPAHRYPVTELSSHSADYFSTPLGDIKVDKNLQNILQQKGLIRLLDQAFEGEHSLEVQLPFLQSILPEFSVLPILTGPDDSDKISEILQLFWHEKDLLFIISTDLSHFHEYHLARELDKTTIEATLHLQYDTLGFDHACGLTGLKGIMKASKELGTEITLLDARNSGDTAGSKNSVVGYASFLINE